MHTGLPMADLFLGNACEKVSHSFIFSKNIGYVIQLATAITERRPGGAKGMLSLQSTGYLLHFT